MEQGQASVDFTQAGEPDVLLIDESAARIDRGILFQVARDDDIGLDDIIAA